MTRNGELQKVMTTFDKTIKSVAYIVSLEREDRENWGRQIYYCNGNTNEFFKVFLCGYSAGKSEYQQ